MHRNAEAVRRAPHYVGRGPLRQRKLYVVWISAIALLILYLFVCVCVYRFECDLLCV